PDDLQSMLPRHPEGGGRVADIDPIAAIDAENAELELLVVVERHIGAAPVLARRCFGFGHPLDTGGAWPRPASATPSRPQGGIPWQLEAASHLPMFAHGL